MMRALLLLSLTSLLTGCLSFHTSESPAAPDYVAFCQEKESQCRQICGDAGIQAFSCKAAPREGLDDQCPCRKPGQRL